MSGESSQIVSLDHIELAIKEKQDSSFEIIEEENVLFDDLLNTRRDTGANFIISDRNHNDKKIIYSKFKRSLRVSDV